MICGTIIARATGKKPGIAFKNLDLQRHLKCVEELFVSQPQLFLSVVSSSAIEQYREISPSTYFQFKKIVGQTCSQIY